MAQGSAPWLVPALGADALRAVSGWLANYEKFSGHAEKEHDFSGMIRPSIRSRQDSYPNTEDSLVDAVRDLALAAMSDDPDGTTRVLLSSGVQLLR
jgi:hypothetical protein